MRLLALLLAMLLPAATAALASDADTVVIDPTEGRALIRKEILRHTPPGSTVDQVRRFIEEQLQVKEVPPLQDAPASGPAITESSKEGERSIQVMIGRHLTNPILLVLPIPLPLMTDVLVRWTFNQNGKLLDVTVDEVVEGS